MNPAELINAALARLDEQRVVIAPVVVDRMGTSGIEIADRLAALIRASDKGVVCDVCCSIGDMRPNGRSAVEHRPDCALIALAKAIVGERE